MLLLFVSCGKYESGPCVGWLEPPHIFFQALSGGIKLQEDGVNVGRPGTYSTGALIYSRWTTV